MRDSIDKDKNESQTITDTIVFSYAIEDSILNFKERELYRQALKEFEVDLAKLNMNRGGTQNISNTSGFVFENLHVADKNIQSIKGNEGKIYRVVNNNGIADIEIKDIKSGEVSYQQAKMGYEKNPYQIVPEKYTGQEIVVDKKNRNLVRQLEKKNVPFERSNIDKNQSDLITKIMKQEDKVWKTVGKNYNAPVTAKLLAVQKRLEMANQIGIQAAVGSAVLTAGISFGKHMYEFIEGNKELLEVVRDTTKDTIVAGAKGWLVATTWELVGTPILEFITAPLANTAIVSLGPVVASVSTVALPILISGMVIGTGYRIIEAIREKQEKYERGFSRIGRELNIVLQSIQENYNILDQRIKDYCNFFDENIEKGFEMVYLAIENNNFEDFSEGIDMIARLYHSSIRFKTREDFDEFFFSEQILSM